ncbi:ATP-dependent helicase [Alcaligenaceae bacterium]|nr:ATP-dependent helicase [Alcaligenaceae bacterium]
MTNITNPVRFIPHGFSPTQEQKNIQLSQHRVTLIEANAGAAKTTTLALRIGEALARGLPPEHILALVFTPEAKSVMKSRLVEIGIPAPLAANVVVRTFDEFALETLQAIEGIGVPQLQQAHDLRPQALAAITSVSQTYGETIEYLDIRTHNIAISQFLECQLRLKATMALDENDYDTGPQDAAERLGIPLTDYIWTLEYERLRLGSFDEARFRGPFDATYDLARHFSEFPESKSILPNYGLVAGDELHDLNEASFRILEALLDKDNLYFVGAGDKDQVIHSSLGADDRYLRHRFADRQPAAVRYPLTNTYRHGPHLAYAMQSFKQKPVTSGLPLVTEIMQSHYPQSEPDACAASVVAVIQKWKADKHPLEACAILLRDRHQSVAIENALMRAKIAYRPHGMQGYIQREEILFLRGMIAIALKNLAMVKSAAIQKGIVEALAIFGELTLSPKDMEEAKDDIVNDPSLLSTFFSGHIQRHAQDQAKVRIANAVTYMQGISTTMPAHEVLHEICQTMDLDALAKRIYVHPHDAAVVTKSVSGFIAVARQSGMNLREFSEWTGAADAFINTRKSKGLVTLECVADSKGKEYDHVILPFLESEEFPSITNPHKQEEENLFYVGATRAKLRLSLVSPMEEALRSPYIKRMQLAASRSRANTAIDDNQRPDLPAMPARTDLNVPYADKDDAKALGALWDPARRVWYVKAGLDTKPFTRWFKT